MLASIHPLGERAKHNRWSVTVTFYVVGSVAGGAMLGGAVGALGERASALVIALCCVAAALLDGWAPRLPSWRRQVNEDWLHRYRGWAYGFGFGFQLGLGVVTIVTTAAVYLTFVLAALSGSAPAGALVGAVFGAARATPLLLLGRVDKPERLRNVHARLSAASAWAQRLTVAGLVGAAVGALR